MVLALQSPRPDAQRMSERLTVAVTRDRYPTQFNIPKHSRHWIEPTLFLPTHRISPRIEGMVLFLAVAL